MQMAKSRQQPQNILQNGFEDYLFFWVKRS